ncbi:hypothetical protein JTE90_020216 [Oedothorax gibbosus]|uniref:Uncharacterized protein n=1 Tax=Oedothorax gibbosus TaxID=931172 RepID=A0AAV6UYD2_9ARAC|nr:hypothetical protein JTE90_020216 [Oedothorax gibbosus]
MGGRGACISWFCFRYEQTFGLLGVFKTHEKEQPIFVVNMTKNSEFDSDVPVIVVLFVIVVAFVSAALVIAVLSTNSSNGKSKNDSAQTVKLVSF